MSTMTDRKQLHQRDTLLMRTIDLGPAQVLPIQQAHTDMRVRVLYGRVWLTEEGTRQDVIASSGDEVALRANGLAVIEGLGLARVQVLDAGRPPLAVRAAEAIGALMRSLSAVATRARVRAQLGPQAGRQKSA